MVSLKNDPPLVVASLAMIMQITPRMVPMPVTMPARRHRVVVKPPGGERRQFEKRAERIDQEIDALAHRNLAAVAMALHHPVAAAGERPGLPRAQRLQQAVIDRGVGLKVWDRGSIVLVSVAMRYRRLPVLRGC